MADSVPMETNDNSIDQSGVYPENLEDPNGSPAVQCQAHQQPPLDASCLRAHIVSNIGCDGISSVGRLRGSPEDREQPSPGSRERAAADGQRVQFEDADSGHHVQFQDCVENGHAYEVASDEDEDQDQFCMSLHSSRTSSSSSSSSDSYSDQFSEARAPDGGWGWVVVFAAFMVNLIADGVTFSFGVIFLEFVKYFGEGKSKTAWIGSLFLAIPLLSGPIASYLTDRYGCRRVCIAGGILAAAGFIISAFINSVEALFFTFGILSGFGLSLCYVTAIVIVAYYFEKRRAFATGLSVCGSGIGTFIFPPFIEFLINNYAWRGATMILAGLFLNLCVCGALMRDLEYTKKKKKKKKDRKLSASAKPNRSRIRTNTASSVDSASQYSYHPSTIPSTEEVKRLLQVAENNMKGDEEEDIGGDYAAKDKKDKLFSSLVSLPTFVRNGEKVPLEVLEGLSTNRHLYAVLVHNYPSLLISSRSISDSGCINEQKRHRNAYTGATPKYSAQFLSDQKPVSVDDNRTSKEESQNSKSISRQETFTEKDAEGKKPEKRRSILKKKSESLKRGLAAVNNANSTWWNKRYTNEYGTESPRLPTAYLRDLKVHRHSLTYRGAMLNIGRYRLRASSCPDIYRNSMTTIAEEKDEWYAGLLDLWYAIADMMDFSYFKNVTFLLFAISNFMLYTWYDVPYVYVADHAVERGFSKTDSIYIISVIGILNMLGEIVYGWAGDRSWVNSRLVYAISIALCGIFIVVIPVFDSYRNICIMSGGFGFLVAANYSLTSIILVESISLEKFTNAYGLLLLVQGIGNLVGPPIAGWLYEINNDFTLPFFLAGIFICISGGLLEVTTCFNGVRRNFKPEVNGGIGCLNSNENLKSKMNTTENKHALNV